MKSLTKNQVFPYSLKTVSCRDQQICGSQETFRILPPQDIHNYQNMWFHLQLQFDATEPVGNQVITGLVVSNAVPPLYTVSKSRTLSVAADANRVIDFSYDVSDMISPTGDNYITILFASQIVLVTKGLRFWKTDMLYTTIGIR